MERTGKLLLITSLFLCFFGLKGWTRDRATNQPDSLELRLMEIYTKREVMIPMRDGVQLYTAIYEPKDNSRKHPTLMMRTPYSCSPYGERFDNYLKTALKKLLTRTISLFFKMFAAPQK